MKVILDKKDIIISLESWNKSPVVPSASLQESEIIGRPFFEFIQGDLAKLKLRCLLHDCRFVYPSMTHHYRCDEAGIKRFFEMDLTLLDNQSVCMEHSLLKIEQKPLAFSINQLETKNRTSHTITRCSLCCKFLWESHWLEAEGFSVLTKIPIAQLFSDSVEYTVCSNCLNKNS